MCIRYCYLGTSERSYSRGYGGRGLSWEGPIGSCSVTPGVWAQQPGKVGLPPGVWGVAGSQSSEGPVSPQGEMGMQWLDRYVWPGRGVQAGNVTGITAGRKRKWQMGHSRLQAGDCGPVGSNSEPERSGCQGISFILSLLCLSVNSHSHSEESGSHHLPFINSF